MHGEHHLFTDATAAAAYTLAGNATLTLKSTKTGTRYTFRVREPKDNKGQPKHFVHVLTGPQNTSDYTYMGMLIDGQLKLTKASTMGDDSGPVKAFRWYVAQVVVGHKMPDQLEIWHEGKCGRCGRKLTVPQSIETGIGPECANMMGGF